MQATKLFYCYAHEDKSLQDQLVKQLASLERLGLIAGWSDRDISAGQQWQKEIDKRLNAADIILLLISPDFIASNYCYSVEVKRAMERHEAGEARVIPIVLRPVYWQAMPFGQLQALPTEGKPINDWRNRDKAFLDVVEGVRKVIEELPPLSDVCPYLGLRAFTEQDHAFFFGRERAVETVLKRLKRSPDFLALLGPSGSGKSSLVQAGVMRQLRLGTWLGPGERLDSLISRPGSDPFAELTLQGLPGTSVNLTERVQVWREQHPEKERLVLIIDQFEEVWTHCSPKMAQDFTGQLVALINASECAGYITLISVMRDDFYPHLGRHEALAELVDASRVRVPQTLRRTELVTIVQEPAKAQRLRFAEGLVDTIIEDILTASSIEVEGELVTDNTILPLLEFALTRIWEQRQERELTREAYHRIGRVSGGLTIWANDTFRRLDKGLQSLARAIFTKLVHVGDESQNIPHSRRKRTLTSLYPEQKDTHFVIARLAEARLLVTSHDSRDGEESVEIIHDVLLREWNLLRDWIAEDRSFLIWRQQFEKRIQLWIETDPNDPFLRDEGRLLRGRDLDEAEHWMAERALDFAPIEQDFIKISRKHAERQHQATIARQLIAHSESIRIQQPERIYLSVILAAEAMRRDPSVGADQALRSAIAFIPHPFAQMSHEKTVKSLAFSPDGRYLITASADCTALVWEMPHAIAVHALTHQGAVNALVFSPDGQCLATASSDHTIGIWEVASWHQMTSLVHQGPLSALTFSLDGKYLAAASEDGTTHIWQIASKEQVATLNHKDSVNAVAFSPDGHYLATGSRDRTASLWEVPSGKQLAQLQHRFPVRSVAFSPDGHSLVTASEDGVVGVWEVPSGKQLQNLKHEWMIGAVIFSPDGRYLVTSGGDRFARVWRMPDGRLLAQLSHVGNTGSTAFSPDGRYLATTGGAMVNVYEVGNWHQMTCLIKGYELHSVVFSPDGKYLASAGQGSTAELWEVTDQPQLAHLICKGVKAMAFTSNDQCLITVGDTVAERWDITRKERLTHFPFRTLPFGDIRLSAEGRYLAATSTGLWDTKSSQQIAGFMAKTVTFNSDGSYLATVRQTGDVMVAEIANGQSVSLSHKDAVTIIVFSPDGRYLATASDRPSDNWGRMSPVTVWELPHDHLIASLHQEELVDKVLFSSHGNYLAVVTPSGAMVWETSTRSQVIAIPGQQVSISDIAFSLDERYLTIAGSSQIQVYEIPQKHFLDPLEHLGIRSVMFSPNGHYLASVSDGHNACVWELTTGRRLAYLGHKDRVSKIAFSPDSSYIATASWDNTVGIWESTTGLQLCRLNHDNKVTDVSFSPNGKYVMSLDWDDTLRVWLWRPEDMIAEAHAHMPRNLTTDEWQTYLGNEPYRKTFEESL